MTAFKVTLLATLLASVSGDAPLSTSYGAPHSDSYGGHGGHETVKRHTAAGGQDCNCSGGSGGSSYNGGSASVHPAYSSRQPTRPNYNEIMAPPQPPPTPTYTQPAYSPSPQATQPQHPTPPQPPPPSYTYPQPAYSPPVPQHPAPPPQPPPPAHPVYSAPSAPAPVASPQPVPPPQPQPSTHPVYSAPSPPMASSHPQHPDVLRQPPPYHLPTYSPPTEVQQVQTQPTKPNYNAIQAPASPPSPVYSGGGQTMYSGGRPDYNAYPPQGYAGWGLSTKPYNFGYSVKDFNQGTDFKQQETSDGNTVKGQYRVQLPDGRLQIVTYTADWQTGFHADVQYEGEASYPAVYGVGGSYPPSSHGSSYGAPSQSYGTPAQSSYAAPAQTSYSAPAQTSYSAPPQTSYGAPSAGSSSSGWNQGGSYQDRVGVGGVGSQYQNIDYSTKGSSYGAPPSSHGTPTSSSYHPTGYGK